MESHKTLQRQWCERCRSFPTVPGDIYKSHEILPACGVLFFSPLGCLECSIFGVSLFLASVSGFLFRAIKWLTQPGLPLHPSRACISWVLTLHPYPFPNGLLQILANNSHFISNNTFIDLNASFYSSASSHHCIEPQIHIERGKWLKSHAHEL